MPTQNKLNGILETFLNLIMLCFGIFYLTSFLIIYHHFLFYVLMDCVHVFLIAFSLFFFFCFVLFWLVCLFPCLLVWSWMGGKDLGGDEGGETVIQINCMKK